MSEKHSKASFFSKSSIFPNWSHQLGYRPLPFLEGRRLEEEKNSDLDDQNSEINGDSRSDKISHERMFTLFRVSSSNFTISIRSLLCFGWHIFYFGLILTGFLIVWMVVMPRPTNLQEQTLTDDGKSFPSGQLTWSQKFTPLPCGKSPTEALSRGCHFDIIATAWLPPRCIDYELNAEFAALHPWKFFHDYNGTDQIPNDPDILGSQEGLIWTTRRWHVAHCLYMWKKLNRALVQGWSTDGEAVKQGHTDHCTEAILDMNMKDLDLIGSILEVIYPPC